MLKYKEGNLVIDLHGLLDSVPKTDLEEFFESVSCNYRVIEHVTSQILDKWTSSGYYAGVCVTATDETHNALDKAWREVAKRSGEVAKREIERLETALKRRNEQYFDLLNELASKNREERF